MTIGYGAMVSAPMVHDFISTGEGAFAGEARSKPSAGPSVVGSFPKFVGYFVRKVDAVTFNDLEDGPKAFDEVKSNHGHRHFSSGEIARAEATTAEIAKISIGPSRGIHAFGDVFFAHLPPRLHNVVAIFVSNLAAGIQALSARIDQMEEAVRFFGVAFDVITGDALYAIATPEGTNIGEDRSAAVEEPFEEHPNTVESVILCREGIGFPGAIPVESAVKQGFGEIAVRIEVSPLTLPLESANNRIVAQSFLFAALWKVLVPVVEVFDDAAHLDRKFPVFFFLLRRTLKFCGVFINARMAVGFRPSKSLFVFLVVIDTQGHAANDFDLINAFHTHSKVFFNEIVVDDGAADAHAARADLQIALPAHRGRSDGGTPEAEHFDFDVFRN